MKMVQISVSKDFLFALDEDGYLWVCETEQVWDPEHCEVTPLNWCRVKTPTKEYRHWLLNIAPHEENANFTAPSEE
jgi:hypothetical protein